MGHFPQMLRFGRFDLYIQIFELVIPVIIAVAIFLFPGWFGFLNNSNYFASLCLTIVVYHGVVYILTRKHSAKSYYLFSRFGWLAFFAAIVSVTGGSNSDYLFLLILPMLAASIDLSIGTLKLLALLCVATFASMVFVSGDEIGITILSRHGFATVLFGLMVFYVFRVVLMAIGERYERDRARRQLAEAVEIDRVKTDFLLVASHQLRTPLGGAKWGLEEVLKMSGLPEEAKNIVERSHNRLNDAVGIVNEMLDSVEQDSQFFKLNFAPVDLNNLIGEIVNELSYLAKKQSVIVQISRSNNAIIVPAENNLLKPAITNIVDNAIRYSPKGTVDIEVKSSLDTAVIVVKDNGSGISKVDQSHIFERFYRGANAIAIDSNESGVGLYTTKRIIDKHKGSISFSSETGKGTTFTVTLPLK